MFKGIGQQVIQNLFNFLWIEPEIDGIIGIVHIDTHILLLLEGLEIINNGLHEWFHIHLHGFKLDLTCFQPSEIDNLVNQPKK